MKWVKECCAFLSAHSHFLIARGAFLIGPGGIIVNLIPIIMHIFEEDKKKKELSAAGSAKLNVII